MKPFKIQNRTLTSRRVKFIKNGGLVKFTQSEIASYVENSREAGFCLTAILPIPLNQNGTQSIELTAHPMGTDGRVSLFANGDLIESKRFSNLARLNERQDWFNQNFGTVIRYSGRENALFESLVIGQRYRVVFEDDDLDYEFGEFGLSSQSTNPTLYVEQYRLAFDLFNNVVEISCDGADYQTPYMVLTGDWELEINGVRYSEDTTTVEELQAILEENGIDVVEEGEEIVVDKPKKVTDFTFRAAYNPLTKRIEGYHRIGTKVALSYLQEDASTPSILHAVTTGDGRWHYDLLVEVGKEYQVELVEYLGDINELLTGQISTLKILSDSAITVDSNSPELPPELTPDVIDPYGLFDVPAGNAHLYYKIDQGDISKVQADLTSHSKINEVASPTLYAILALIELTGNEDPAFKDHLLKYTDVANLQQAVYNYGEPAILRNRNLQTLVVGSPNTKAIEGSTSITFYRGLSQDSIDLFDRLFPDYIGNYITLTSTAAVDEYAYLVPSGLSVAIQKHQYSVFVGMGGYYLVDYDVNDKQNVRLTTHHMDDLVPLSGDLEQIGQIATDISIEKIEASPDERYLLVTKNLTVQGQFFRLVQALERSPEGALRQIAYFSALNHPYASVLAVDNVAYVTDGWNFGRYELDTNYYIYNEVLDGEFVGNYLIQHDKIMTIRNMPNWETGLTTTHIELWTEQGSQYVALDSSAMVDWTGYYHVKGGCVTLNATHAVFVYNAMIYLIVTPVEGAPVITLLDTLVPYKVDSVQKLNETETTIDLLFIERTLNFYSIRRFNKETSEFSEIAGMSTLHQSQSNLVTNGHSLVSFTAKVNSKYRQCLGEIDLVTGEIKKLGFTDLDGTVIVAD